MFSLYNRRYSSEEIFALLQRYNLLDMLLAEIAVDCHIAADQIVCDESKVSREIELFCKYHKITNLDVWLEQNDWQLVDLQQYLSRLVLVEKFKSQKFLPYLNKYYKHRRPDLSQVVYSIIRTTNIEIIYELYFRLVEGEATLGELAQQFSEGPEKDTDGIVGPIPCEQIPLALRQVIVSAKIGIVMPPIFLDSWAAIVRVEKITPSSCMDEEIEQKLIGELFNNWKARAIREAKSNLKPWFP